MEQLLQQLEAYRREIEAYDATSADGAEQFRITYLGSKGLVKNLMGEMKQAPVEKKKEFGQILNDFKQFTEAKYAALKEAAADNGQVAATAIDISLPGDDIPVGSRHPISMMRNRIVSIFQRLGFSVAEGPEIEDDWHNFTALNLPEHHPARDMQDTFYISTDPAWLLRTHTSNIQNKVNLF